MFNLPFGRVVIAWLVSFRVWRLLILLVHYLRLVLPRFWSRLCLRGWRRWLVDGSRNLGLFVGVRIF